MMRSASIAAPGLRGATRLAWIASVLALSTALLVGCEGGSSDGSADAAVGYGPLDLDAAGMQAKVTEMLATRNGPSRSRTPS